MTNQPNRFALGEGEIRSKRRLENHALEKTVQVSRIMKNPAV